MRLGRSAALAASAAIASSLDNTFHDEDEDTSTTFFEDDSHSIHPKSKKSKAKKRKLAIAFRNDGVIISDPAPIDRLPYELRREILQHLDAYSLLNMLLVSKIWYLTLMQSQQAERDWENLCRRMGAKKKSPGQLTWHANFMNLLHKRCVYCFEPSTQALGQSLLYGFRYLVVCDECEYFLGPFSVHTLPCLAEKHGLNLEDLQTVPITSSTRQKVKFVPRTLRDPWLSHKDLSHCATDAAVCQLKLSLEKLQPMLLANCPSNRDLFQQACDHSAKHIYPVSVRLNRAIATLRLKPDRDDDDYFKVIGHYQAMVEILYALRKAFNDRRMRLLETVTPSLDSVWSSLLKKTWIDALALGDTTLEKYIRAVEKKAIRS